jgi:hypothetical protein
MTDPMKKQLDEMLAQHEALHQQFHEMKDAKEAEPAPPAEVDPLAHLIGNTDPDADKDPFTMMLDGMLEQEGMSKESETPEHKTEGFEEHEWEFKSELVYEEDIGMAICRKCFRQMHVGRQQSWNEAMLAHGVNFDCGMGVAQDVTDS